MAEFADILVMNDASSDMTSQVVQQRNHDVVTQYSIWVTEVRCSLVINMRFEKVIDM